MATLSQQRRRGALPHGQNASRRRRRRRRRAWISAASLLTPALVLLVLFHLWPLVEMIRLSLVNLNVFTGASPWVGLDNFRQAASDPIFRESLWVTLVFFVIKVPLQTVLALGLALFIVKPGPGVTLARTVILLPTVTSLVVVSTLWGMMLNGDQGLLNGALNAVGLPSQAFLTSTTWALPTVALITVWRDVGLMALFFVAGLLSVVPELYDAAAVDGASRRQLFRHITLPLLKPTTVFVIVVSSIAAFKIFVPVDVLTSGGPSGSTRVVIYYMVQVAFRFGQFSYATAISVVVMVVLLAISMIQLGMFRRKAAL